jgi:Na+/proline symporter
MSTADGAILAMGTVFSHNIMRQLDGFYPNLVTSKNLLFVARLSTIPLALTSTLIAAYYKSTSSSAGATGYLLIVAFDIVLATTVAPIFGCFYVKNPSPRAAFCSTMLGVVVRVVLEFTLPKDGFLLLPYDEPEFLDYGPAASSLFPPFFDEAPENLWNATAEPCTQERFEDYTGTDSMAAFVCSILAFVIVQAIENKTGKPLFSFPGMDPYEKDLGNESGKASEDVGKKVPGEDSDKGVPGEEVDEEESLEADA